jgi:hypothetical protein
MWWHAGWTFKEIHRFGNKITQKMDGWQRGELVHRLIYVQYMLNKDKKNKKWFQNCIL